MNLILSTPMDVRLIVLFLLGACIGGAVNWAIYSLAWFPRPISPWSRPDPTAPPRRFADRLPIVGWFGLRRESFLHGQGFWLRPMLLEVFAGLGLAWLYWWEIGRAGLLSPRILLWDPVRLSIRLPSLMTVQYCISSSPPTAC